MPALLAACYAILVTAVLFGMTTLGGLLPRLISPAELGLGTNRVGIEPLTDRFIDQVLGPGSEPVGVPIARTGLRGERGIGTVDDSAGQVVEHELTNDDQQDAYPVSRLPFTARSNTTQAGREPGEPGCGPQVAGGSVWYRYRAVARERLLADTFMSNYQTSLAAYRADGSGLTQLACHTDTEGNAQIELWGATGATYLFQIGAAIRGGDLVFHLSRLGPTSLASISSDGWQGDGWSWEPSLSHDGRYVAFTSYSVNLTREGAPTQSWGGVQTDSCIPWDFNGPCPNIFFRDRLTRTTRLVTVKVDGEFANAESARPSVSDDGRYVAFSSRASNLVEKDTNGAQDVFVRDMTTGRFERASVASDGRQTAPDPVADLGLLDPDSDYRATDYVVGDINTNPVLSGDGRFVAFESTASSLDPRDINGQRDAFVRDRVFGTTFLACLDHQNRPSPQGCRLQGFSRNGRWVVFETEAPMSADDHDQVRDVFVRDLRRGTTERVSGAPGGRAANGGAVVPPAAQERSISDDGRFVVFGSNASNLVRGDTNAAPDIFVHDRLTRRTERVSVSSSGTEGVSSAGGIEPRRDPAPGSPSWSISADGRHVSFDSFLVGLVPDDADKASDVFLHDRSTKRTIRISFPGQGSEGDLPSDSAQVSGDGKAIAFRSDLKLSDDDVNGERDVFIYQRSSPRVTEERVGPLTSSPTASCGASSEYTTVGLAGAHEDVMPAVVPDAPESLLAGDAPAHYPDHSVVRFKYRIDVSGSSTKPSAQMAGVKIALRWDYPNVSDYDLYVYDANGELLAYSFKYNPLRGINESVVLSRVPHCSDLRVDIVTNLGLPKLEMTLDTTLGGLGP